MKRSLQLFGFACFGLLLAGTFADVALAQPPEGGRQRGGFGGGRGFGGGGFGGAGGGETMLLANEKVQKELELIDDQVKEIAKLREESQAQTRGLFEGTRDLPEAERRAKFQEISGKMEAAQKELRGKINEVLLPNQKDRLKELVIQFQGTGALNNAETADALKLTEDQKKQLATVREEAGTKMREAMGPRREAGQAGGQGGPSEEVRAKFQEIQKEISEKSLVVLTTEQKAQFEKMKGEKSDIDFTQLRGPGGRGGPGGGRPNNAPNN